MSEKKQLIISFRCADLTASQRSTHVGIDRDTDLEFIVPDEVTSMGGSFSWHILERIKELIPKLNEFVLSQTDDKEERKNAMCKGSERILPVLFVAAHDHSPNTINILSAALNKQQVIDELLEYINNMIKDLINDPDFPLEVTHEIVS